MATTLDSELGTGMGGGQAIEGVRSINDLSWDAPIRKARRPAGARRLVAIGTMSAKCSTARRVTQAAAGMRAPRVSARPVITLTSINVRARANSRRKAAFL